MDSRHCFHLPLFPQNLTVKHMNSIPSSKIVEVVMELVCFVITTQQFIFKTLTFSGSRAHKGGAIFSQNQPDNTINNTDSQSDVNSKSDQFNESIFEGSVNFLGYLLLTVDLSHHQQIIVL